MEKDDKIPLEPSNMEFPSKTSWVQAHSTEENRSKMDKKLKAML
jgi:hypothetical protein